MNWEDECYLLSKRKFRENANIINVFTKSKGKVSGVVYGGNSRKIRNYLQLSNKLFVVYNSKNENKAGYFKTELIKPVSPSYFNDKKRTSALISLCSILNILLPELQPNQNIFKSFEKLIESLNFNKVIIVKRRSCRKFKVNYERLCAMIASYELFTCRFSFCCFSNRSFQYRT